MKRRGSRVLTYVASLLVFWAIAAPAAHAYIDPGSTNFIIQIIIGALAGAGLAIATFWRRIKNFFSKNKSEPSPTPPAAAETPAASTETPPTPPAETNPTE